MGQAAMAVLFMMACLVAAAPRTQNLAPMVPGHMREEVNELLNSQMHFIQLDSGLELPEFFAKYHILPIVDEMGKLTWTYSDSDSNARKPWVGNPEEEANFHLDFHRYGLDKLGLTPDRINYLVSRDNAAPSTPAASMEQTNVQMAKPITLNTNAALQAREQRLAGKIGGLDYDMSKEGMSIPEISLQALGERERGMLTEEDVDFYSDMSHEKLEYGRWFHRIGTDFDISDKEWQSLSPADKSQFTLVSTPQDKMRIAREKVMLNVESSPISLPALQTPQQQANYLASAPPSSSYAQPMQAQPQYQPQQPILQPQPQPQAPPAYQAPFPQQQQQQPTIVYQTNVYTDSSRGHESNPITIGSPQQQPIEHQAMASPPQEVEVNRPSPAAQHSEYVPPSPAASGIPPPQSSEVLLSRAGPAPKPQFEPENASSPPPSSHIPVSPVNAPSPGITLLTPPSSPPSPQPSSLSLEKISPDDVEKERDQAVLDAKRTLTERDEAHSTGEAREQINDLAITYYSDLSDKPLEYGHWYHKVGGDFDITDAEWKYKIKEEEKSKFVLIKSIKDRLVMDKAAEHTGYVSSLSNQPLQYGHWYHKIGADFDISDSEYDTQVATSEKDKYAKIETKKDKILVKIDSAEFNKPVFSDISNNALTYGHWYHKMGGDFDITDYEYHNMIPENERNKYTLIHNKEDRATVEAAPLIPESGPVKLNIAPTTPQPPSASAHLITTANFPATTISLPAPAPTPKTSGENKSATKAIKFADVKTSWPKDELRKQSEEKAVAARVGRQSVKPSRSAAPKFKTSKAGATNVMAQKMH